MKPAPVLFIAPRRISDGVRASAVLRQLDDVRVTIVANKNVARLYEAYPKLDRLITTSSPWLLCKQLYPTRWATIWDLRETRYARFLRADKRRRFHGVETLEPMLQQYARQLGVENLPDPLLWTHNAHHAQAKALLPDDQRYMMLAPAGKHAWPMQHYIDLARGLLSESGPCTDMRPVIVSSATEREACAPLLEALAPYRPIDLTRGALPLLSVYACMMRAQGFIGNDAGPLHLAASAGTVALGLYGPTDPAICKPEGPKAAWIRAPQGDFELLSVQAVIEKFASLL